MKTTVLGNLVHFLCGSDQLETIQGVIVAAWLESGESPIDEQTMRVTVQCEDGKYRDAWLTNCIYGPIPLTEEQIAEREQEQARKKARRKETLR